MNTPRKTLISLLAGAGLLAGAADVGALELPTVDANGNEITITLPDDVQQAWDALNSDMNSIAQQTGVAIDELVASVSGCITDRGENPIIGAMVFLVKPDSNQPLAYATTAGRTGIGFYTTNPVGAPLPYNSLPGQEQPAAGCYWMAIPLGLLDALFTTDIQATTVGVGITQVGLGNDAVLRQGGNQPADGTTYARLFSLVAVAPGYLITPMTQVVGIHPDGSFIVLNRGGGRIEASQ